MDELSGDDQDILKTLLERGDWFARNGQLDKSFSAYSNASRVGVVPKECLTSLVTAFLEFQRNKLCKEGKEETLSQDANDRESIFLCSMCNCVFMRPVTLCCGHTFCEVCLAEEQSFTGYVECSKCGKDVSGNIMHSAVNVLITNSIQKWFPLEYQRQVKKTQAHQYLLENDATTAIACFTEILSASANDFHCLCWRSDAFLQVGRLDLALQDIEQACKLRPSSAKTFFRKAVVLANVAKLEGVLSSKHEESVLALLRCSALAPRSDRYRQEFTENLHQLLSPKFTNSNRTLMVLKLGRAGIKKLAPEHETTAEEMDDSKHFTPTPVDTLGYLASPNEVIASVKTSGECNANDDGFASCTKNNSGGKFKKRRQRSLSFSISEETPCTDHPTRTNKLVKKPKNENGAVGVERNENSREVEDFECKLCYSLLFQPITTICGHTFCQECLERCLDHRVECPCCRAVLDQYNRGIQHMEITEVLELILAKHFTADYNERRKRHQEKMNILMSMGKGDNPQVPIFVCTLALPKVPCPLHIFEPKYRLMLRRCVKSGAKQFGMCVGSDDPNKEFADYGTMLNVQTVNFLPDGRSIVHTVGGRRFRVISRSMLDGYHTASVEWLQDESVEDEEELKQLIELNRVGHITLQTWFSKMTTEQRQCITNAIGPVPAFNENLQLLNDGPDWVWWVLAALPLQDKAKLIILGMTSILERLRSVIRFLQLMLSLQNNSMDASSSVS